MARPASEYPTELELQILKVLWEDSPANVEQVRIALGKIQPPRELTYSSVITMLNIMVKKSLLSRSKTGRAFDYLPKVEEKDINRGMVGDLVKRVFDGSASALMLEVLETQDLDSEELKLVRRMINRKTREQAE
jgi:predicted transcriptional regulator